MVATITLTTVGGLRMALSRCEDKLRDFCLHDAYRAYDRVAAVNDIVTMQQFNAVNDAMKARTPLNAWKPFLTPNVIPHLPQVPKNLDLIDSPDMDYHAGRENVRRVYEVLASRQYITDMAASKICYLKRPSLIAISDSYVRRLLLGPDQPIDPQDAARGAKYADRGIAVMDAIRHLGHLNADPLRQLWTYVHNLKVDGQPVSLSKARILDILIWVEMAIKEGHFYWSRWGEEGPAAPPPNPQPETPATLPGEAPTDIACPKCGGNMVQRTGPNGPFYGCSRFPACKGTRSFFQCPQCGGEMVRREGPNGPFYGCLRYPKCKGTRSIQGPPPPPQVVSEQIGAWTTIPHEIKAEHVHAAIAEIERNGVPPSRQSMLYDLVYQGRCYPPKYVVSLAAKHATGQALPSNRFSGGSETNAFLRAMGFEVTSKGKTPAAAEPQHENIPMIPQSALQESSDGWHNDRCRECKAAVLALLQKLYGAVETQKQFDIGTKPDAFRASVYAADLQNVFAALQGERGFAEFVRSAVLPPCDYYVPEAGFVVEFDESQHFTALRQVALARYASSLPSGFDRGRWVKLCCRIQARDDDPPYRDEQRAWYDTLRDFLPTVFPLRPTVRLYALEYPWCTLNPNDPKDVETFRQVLSERAYFWTIEVISPPTAKYGRLVMDGAWSGDLCAARQLLRDVAAALPKNRRLTCLCTCGAFLRFDWPAGLPYQGNLDPTPNEVGVLTEAAESAVRKVLTKDLTEGLRTCSDYLTLGVDTKKDKVSTSEEIIEQPHAELVCLVDLRSDSIRWTGKFYPTVGQQRSIVRFPDLESHFVSLDGDPVMILGCHDLSVYSARSQARARGWRQNLNSEFRALAAKHRPVEVLHHPHTTTKSLFQKGVSNVERV